MFPFLFSVYLFLLGAGAVLGRRRQCVRTSRRVVAVGTVLLLLLLLLLLDKVVLVVPGHERQRLRGVGSVLVVVVAQSVVVVLLLSNVGDGGGVRVVAVVGPVASLLWKYHNTSQVQVEPTDFFTYPELIAVDIALFQHEVPVPVAASTVLLLLLLLRDSGFQPGKSALHWQVRHLLMLLLMVLDMKHVLVPLLRMLVRRGRRENFGGAVRCTLRRRPHGVQLNLVWHGSCGRGGRRAVPPSADVGRGREEAGHAAAGADVVADEADLAVALEKSVVSVFCALSSTVV